MASTPQRPPVDLAFVFIGGMHQAWHMAPVALALATRSGVAVTAYVPPDDEEALRALVIRLDPDAAGSIRITSMILPIWARLFAKVSGGGRKPAMLLAWRRRLLRHDALVAAERTSTLLKRLPGRRPLMIHIPHGAGDRAKGFEPRIRLFDHLLVTGPRVRNRMVAEGLAKPEAVDVVGSIKLAALTAGKPAAQLFDDGRRVVLYNPHFQPGLSSWPLAEALVRQVAAAGRFNIIVAPHIRMLERLGDDERARWDAIGAIPGVLVDFASDRLIDMTYVRAADVYLGDVSSQVYEFLHVLGPVVFLDAHATDWRGRDDYSMWTMGDVARSVPEALAALNKATERHAAYRSEQAALANSALGPVDAGVPERAADALLAALDRLSPSRMPG